MLIERRIVSQLLKYLKLMVVKNGFKKYNIYVILDLVFIILGPFLQIIYVDRLILITNIFKSLQTPYEYICKPITMDLLFLVQKVKQLKNCSYKF